MNDKLISLEEQVPRKRNVDAPPLHLWDPPLSGDIPIVIESDGSWFHDGGRIERESLVRLFASILRREADGEYYLVTPVEKWRIRVALHPLIVTDVDSHKDSGGEGLQLTLNTGRQLFVDEEHPLFLEPAVGNIACVQLDHGLSALFSRAAWYRLVDMAVNGELVSRGYHFSLGQG